MAGAAHGRTDTDWNTDIGIPIWQAAHSGPGCQRIEANMLALVCENFVHSGGGAMPLPWDRIAPSTHPPAAISYSIDSLILHHLRLAPIHALAAPQS